MKPRDQPGWHKASEWLLALTLAVHGFGNDYYSAQSRVSEQDVKEVFQKYGKILHTQIWKSQKGGSWAFVTFASMEDRDAAMHDLNGQTVDLWTRNGNRQILWQTPLRVTAPRFHSVRFHYDQYAAKRIVPVEMVFTPSAEPGQGGSFQRALRAPPRRPYVLPPTGPRHGRRRAQNISIDTSFNNRHDRPSSPAPSNTGMSIQWGHEPRETPEPSSPAYDSEKTYCSSGENCLPGDDDGEEMEEYDSAYGEDDARPRSPSPCERPASPMPSSRYDDQDDTSVYPQSSRGTAEPSSQNRKRRRYDDDYYPGEGEDEDTDLRATIRELREKNSKLERELEDARYEADALREDRTAMAKQAEAERQAYHQRTERLMDSLLAQLERRRDEPPQKRNKFSSPYLEQQSYDEYAPFPMTTTSLLSSLQANPTAAAALLSAFLPAGHTGQVANANQ
ncbi:hypothetical protein FRC04_005021 [Tulasnella sp. 424]|nr:hypothetical protein FRC04_005021 [Tulasnella sp. 424]KAG8963368.1 hypothetical protein FRC05_004756 [Tulasnella sp. 425]